MKRWNCLAAIGLAALSWFSTDSFAGIERLKAVNSDLVRGGQPQTVEDFRYLKQKYGIKTVITFRTTPSTIDWEKNLVESLGMKAMSFPFDGDYVSKGKRRPRELPNACVEFMPIARMTYGVSKVRVPCSSTRSVPHGQPSHALQLSTHAHSNPTRPADNSLGRDSPAAPIL
ncbi:MAG: hypothetical protein EOO38_30110 [Cytophagaceae bacterium]|nr:MAG: hypothetical protein EOO38_30110 [Cytophagaceae bacterium]